MWQGSLNSKLISYASKDDCDPVPHYLMWKYIAYVRKNVKEVKLNEEACQVIRCVSESVVSGYLKRKLRYS